MNKSLGLLTMASMLAVSSLTAAATSYELIRPLDPKGVWKTVFQGHFSKNESYESNQTIFAFLRGPIQEEIYTRTYTFSFAGRTGENTFEILKVETDFLLGRKTEKRIPLYFQQSDTVNLEISEIFPGCKGFNDVKIKLVKLEGNRLEAQTILPECIK